MVTHDISRLTSEERKTSIIMASIPLFSKQGFDGTTTKQIADAAGISEALLYKHFPSKDSLFLEIQNHICCVKPGQAKHLSSLLPSTETLVLVIYFLVQKIVLGIDRPIEDHKTFKRLMFRSILEDGQFAKQFHTTYFEPSLPAIEACLEAAKQAGDLVSAIPHRASVLLAHHLCVALSLYSLPDMKVIQYPASTEEMADFATRFILRGIGLSENAIQTHFNTEKFKSENLKLKTS